MGSFEPYPDDGTADETVVYLATAGTDQMACARRLRDEVTDEEKRVLIFTVMEDTAELDQKWDRYVGEDASPERVAIIRAAPGERGVENTEAESGTPVHTLHTDPNDLTGIAIAIARVTKEWEGEPVAVCLRDLDILLRYHDEDTVFKFLNSALASLEGTSAHVHGHLRPRMMEPQQAHAIASLFDRVEGDEETLG